MRTLLNHFYVMNEQTYLSLDGENVVVWKDSERISQLPLHNLEAISYFGYKGASAGLLGACAEKGIALNFFKPSGRYLASVAGDNRGNVLLRKQQYRVSDDPKQSCRIARNFIFGKVYNGRWCLERTMRDHEKRVDAEQMKHTSNAIKQALPSILECESLETLRGLEGECALRYFGVFDELILNQKEDFFFHERSRRPPKDRMNVLLSFGYSMLANDCAAALQSVGLDPYVGFLHRDRPGRRSLALDLMEELRVPMVDRFVLTLVNMKQMQKKLFREQESGAVLFTDEGRRAFLGLWQARKREDKITHPYLQEKIPWGLVPFVQAQLLARYLRGDLDEYPPFLWK